MMIDHHFCRRYNREKKAQGGDMKSKDHIELLIPTADRLAKAHGVSPATIKRDAAAVAAIIKRPRR